MKIIWTDGYDRDYIDDKVVCENVRSNVEGEVMLAALRAAVKGSEDQWYKLVEDDYKLKKFES